MHRWGAVASLVNAWHVTSSWLSLGLIVLQIECWEENKFSSSSSFTPLVWNGGRENHLWSLSYHVCAGALCQTCLYSQASFLWTATQQQQRGKDKVMWASVLCPLWAFVTQPADTARLGPKASWVYTITMIYIACVCVCVFLCVGRLGVKFKTCFQQDVVMFAS